MQKKERKDSLFILMRRDILSVIFIFCDGRIFMAEEFL